MYRSLLVPLDGSRSGEQALPLALALARHAKAVVQLVHVHVPLGRSVAGNESNSAMALDLTVRAHAKDYLEAVVRRLTAVSPVRVTTALLDGPVEDAIYEQALARGADVVVMTTHGRGPLNRLWFGSVADNLVRRMPVPLLLVKPSDDPQGTVPNLSDAPPLMHILIPLDGSELAEQILEPATQLGSLVRADYTLLRVVEPILLPPFPVGSSLPGGLDSSLIGQIQAEAKDYLDSLAERLRKYPLNVQTCVVVHPSPAVAILKVAQTHVADLIALATHGRGGLGRLLLGSVADKVLRGTSLPVLLCRPRTT